MKKVKFLRDFRGILTGEQYREAGGVMELPDENALALVEQGVVELVKPPKAKKEKASPLARSEKKE